MTKIKIDLDLIASLALEIGDRCRLISKLIPVGEDQSILRHLASVSIHNALFIQDVYNYSEGQNPPTEDYVKKFLADCGCDFNKKDSKK